MMRVLVREENNWRWWKPRYVVEVHDMVFGEYYRYEQCTWLQMVVFAGYYRKRGAKVEAQECDCFA